jgi:hypothetical protein
VLFFQHVVLVLVFKQKLCLSLIRWLGRLTRFFSLSFSGSCLVSSSLSEVGLVLRFWRSALWLTNYPALELGFHCVGLLGACFSASCPLSGARSEIPQLAFCCQCVMLVCWLFFNFGILSDFGCCSVAQEMSFVDCYLLYFRQRLIILLFFFCAIFSQKKPQSFWADIITISYFQLQSSRKNISRRKLWDCRCKSGRDQLFRLTKVISLKHCSDKRQEQIWMRLRARWQIRSFFHFTL